MWKRTVVAALIACASTLYPGAVGHPSSAAATSLGRRLFTDDRFASPQGDFRTSCASCHFFDDNAQGLRAGADFLSRSWIPWRSRDPRRHTVRNTPTLVDVGSMPALHFDGEFSSLETLVAETLSGRTMGWLPDEREQAAARIQSIALSAEYRDALRDQYGIDVASVSPREAELLVSGAIADYVRTIQSRRDTPYDLFIATNALPVEPEAAETSAAFGARLMSAIATRQRAGGLRVDRRFSRAALDGLRIFFDSRRGNCMSCHPPPRFTDGSYHNIGITQADYDGVHGEGRFASMTIPSAHDAPRPVAMLRDTPDLTRPGAVDLGYWNFANLRTSSLRRAAETDDAFLARIVATFKTPTLRNLALTSPYMHNGVYQNLPDALAEMIRLNGLAQTGQLRASDEAFGAMRITTADVEPLIAFLATLNEPRVPAPSLNR
jgi:cytochrome c peroxidase